jgi:hypothetical protein
MAIYGVAANATRFRDPHRANPVNERFLNVGSLFVRTYTTVALMSATVHGLLASLTRLLIRAHFAAP